MGLFRRSKKPEWHDRHHLSEDFRSLNRSEPNYPFAMDGLELTGNNLEILLEEFCQDERPLIHLYLPKEHGEEAHDFMVQRLGRNSLSIADLSFGRESSDFMRESSFVRFGFEHKDYTYVFETDVLGRLEGDDPLFLVVKPEKIVQERRSHKRYKLWPEHRAFFNGMQVQDISQRGLQVFSEDPSLQYEDVLENATLSLPPVYDVDTEDCYFEGAEIEVPQSVVTYKLKKHKYSFYGFQFQGGWPLEYIKNLNDFLLGLRKRIFFASEE